MAKVTKKAVKQETSLNYPAIIILAISVIIIIAAGLVFYYQQAKVGIEIKPEDMQTINVDRKLPPPVVQQTPSLINVRQDEILGPILVAANGMTLYSLSDDTDGVSTCDDECAVKWPPLILEGELVGDDEATGILAVIERADGQRQVTYNGAPLYYYGMDKVPGDVLGNGINDKWSIVIP